MQKHTLIITLGVLIVLVPFLGIPSSWKAVLSVVFGLAIAGIGYLLRRESSAMSATERRADTYVENSIHAEASGEEPAHGYDEAEHQQ